MIAATDREMIEAAIAAGKVRRIPQGVSGLALVGDDWRTIQKNISANQERGRRLQSSVKSSLSPAEVDATIRRLYFAGASYDAIGAAVGLVKSAVWRRCRSLGLPWRKQRRRLRRNPSGTRRAIMG